MKTIWKYSLGVTCDVRQMIKIPSNAQFLSCHAQHNQICLWFLVESNNPTVDAFFWVSGTGWEVKWCIEKCRFLGTALTFNEDLIWHVFQEL